MVKLEIELSDIDYDTLVERYLPKAAEHLRASGNPAGMLLGNGMSAAMAKKVLSAMPRGAKDRLAADLINGNRAQLLEAFSRLVEREGLRVSVDKFIASAEQ